MNLKNNLPHPKATEIFDGEVREQESWNELDDERDGPKNFGDIKSSEDITRYMRFLESPQGKKMLTKKRIRELNELFPDEIDDDVERVTKKKNDVVDESDPDIIQTKAELEGLQYYPDYTFTTALKATDLGKTFRCKTCNNRVFNQDFRYKAEDPSYYWFKSYFEHHVVWKGAIDPKSNMDLVCYGCNGYIGNVYDLQNSQEEYIRVPKEMVHAPGEHLEKAPKLKKRTRATS